VWSRAGRRLLVATGVLTALAVAVPTAAWAVGTAATPHSGSIPTAVSGSGSAGVGSAGGGFGGGGFGGGAPGGAGGGFGGAGRTGGTGTGSGTAGGTGKFPGGTGTFPGGTAGAEGTEGSRPTGTKGGTGGFGGGTTGGATTSSALVKALEKTTTRWAAAVEGSSSAASLELASGGEAVMAMGGFTGSDPAPTLAQFEAWTKAGDITYYIAGGGIGGGRGGSGSSSQITGWVKAHYKSATIGGETVYLLLQPTS
jgi:hypothetical protein